MLSRRMKFAYVRSTRWSRLYTELQVLAEFRGTYNISPFLFPIDSPTIKNSIRYAGDSKSDEHATSPTENHRSTTALEENVPRGQILSTLSLHVSDKLTATR